MKLRCKLLHLVRMATNESYRQDQERRVRFARIMAASNSIMEGR